MAWPVCEDGDIREPGGCVSIEAGIAGQKEREGVEMTDIKVEGEGYLCMNCNTVLDLLE